MLYISRGPTTNSTFFFNFGVKTKITRETYFIFFSANFGQSIHNDLYINFPVVLVVSFNPKSIADEKKHKIQKPPALRRKKQTTTWRATNARSGFWPGSQGGRATKKKDRFQSLIRHFKADIFVFHRYYLHGWKDHTCLWREQLSQQKNVRCLRTPWCCRYVDLSGGPPQQRQTHLEWQGWWNHQYQKRVSHDKSRSDVDNSFQTFFVVAQINILIRFEDHWHHLWRFTLPPGWIGRLHSHLGCCGFAKARLGWWYGEKGGRLSDETNTWWQWGCTRWWYPPISPPQNDHF